MVLDDDDMPDSVFVEDTALITPKMAVLTNPGAISRVPEVENIKGSIEKVHNNIVRIDAPGTLEAGDVMMVGGHFYIGLSERTNAKGAQMLINILENHGMTGSVVSIGGMLHLKSGVSYLENNNLLISRVLFNTSSFSQYNKIVVEEDEAYAANSVWINDKVLVPSGYPKTARAIHRAGYEIVEIDMSEFKKLDGGLSCLSLRF
jgi:dimethylargininase